MTSNELWTVGVAAYAAVVSTFVLGWDFYKWLESGPKVRLTASSGMQLIGGVEPDPKTYVSVTAVNVGDRATTITNLGFVYYETWFKLWFRRNRIDKGFIITGPSQAQPIPYRFEPGAQWIGLAHQDESVEAMIRDGYLFAVLYHSHSGKGVRCRLKPKKNAKRNSDEI